MTCARVCACRGARTCLLCQGSTGEPVKTDKTSTASLYHCHNCGKIGSVGNIPEDSRLPPLHACKELCSTNTILHSCSRTLETPLEGVTVVKEFITQEEERAILSAIDSNTWTDSQSGRRKQDYGPKVNFKQQKLKLGLFSGLPRYIEPFVVRMQEEVDELTDFVPVELCNLDYRPEMGAHIEEHCDDTWLWGERLVTINLLSPILLTFTLAPSTTINHPSPSNHTHSKSTPTHPHIHIPLPSRSLVIVQGPARHLWFHSIQSRNVINRRVGITLREMTNEFMPGGKSEDIGRHILEIAQQFNGQPTNL